jgi:POT family proton-dependent oligopeptide transporter
MSQDAAQDERDDRFPPGIPFIVGNEGAERFSYYGMRAILFVYLAQLYVQFLPEAQLAEGVADAARAQSTAVTHLFMAGVYAFPMIGAILADRLLGKYPVIFWVSIIYVAGHAVLAVAGRLGAMGEFTYAEWGMYAGLALIAIGAGGIKPCVSANVGDQFTRKNGHLVTKVFQIFYFIINFGSFFSTLLTPLIMRELGAEVAFALPGVMMAIAAVVFYFGRDRFVKVPPKPGGALGGLDFTASVLFFSPIVALIVAVFIVGEEFEPAARAGTMSAAEFYWIYVRDYVGFLAAHAWYYFAGAAVLFALGIGVFALRQRTRPAGAVASGPYRDEPEKKQSDGGFLAVLFYAVSHQKDRKKGMGFFEVAKERFGEEAAEGPAAVLRIMLVFSMVSVFWALFDQHASTWIEQANQMHRAVDVPVVSFYVAIGATIALALYGGTWLMLWVSNIRVPRFVHGIVAAVVVLTAAVAAGADVLMGKWMQVELEAAQISALNPLMVMIIIPSLNFFLYRPLEKRGITVKPLVKMTIGMFLAAIAFGAAAFLQQTIEARGANQVHVLWQIAQYLVMTSAEVLVSVTGLEFAYTQAPRSMKSTIMGFWLLCVTFGNVLVAFLAPMQTILTLSQFFWVFTALMGVAAIVFTIMAVLYKGKTYLQNA